MAASIEQTPIEAALPDLEKSTYDKVFWRTVPLFFVCYVVSYLDRVNIGFAKLQMLGDLNLSDNVYALAASMLFWGYMLFEMPSNLVLHRVGARRWISRIMISWGCVSISMMYIEPLAALFHTTPATMFYVLRFLLGVCEAGFFPGVVFYLNQWFPSHKQNRVLAGFMFALPLSLCIGGPLSGWILQNMHDAFGHRGWQWMLLIEGLPAVILGIVVLARLTDSVDKAHWLSADEKALVKRNLASENAHKAHNFGAALKSPVIWLLCAILLTMNTGFYGLSFWLPSIIQATGLKNVYHVGLLSALPYVVAGAFIVANAVHSNRTGERRFHAAIPAGCAGIALILSAAWASQLGLSLLTMSIAAAGIIGVTPLFWIFSGRALTGAAAAAGLAMINSIGSLAGITGAMITNVAKNVTGSVNSGTYVLGACLLLCALLILLLPRAIVSADAPRP